MTRLWFPCFILMSAAAFGCNRNKSDAPAAASAAPAVVPSASAAPIPSVSATPPAAAASDTQAAPAASQVPTQEDYENKAKAVVTSKSSAAQELSKIEKEIGQ